MGFLFAQRYTNFAWAWGKGDNPKGSELTNVCNYSCQQKLLHYSARTYFNQKKSLCSTTKLIDTQIYCNINIY